MFGSGKHYSMEEEQERRHVREIELEGGQPSRNSGQTGLDPEEHRIDIVEISPRDFKKLYESRVISIGPYHHGKPHLHPVQMIKPRYAQKFLADRNRLDIEALYTKILGKIEEVRNCYDKRPMNKYDDKKLAWMMLLDGCFLLQFIRRIDDMSKVLRKHQISFVRQDLFLLENQLPFGVLKLIFEGAKFNGGSTMEQMITYFVTGIRRLERSTSEIQLDEPSHLLGLLRSALLGGSKQEQQLEKKGKSSLFPVEDGGSCCPWKKGKRGIRQSFQNIKELKAVGIHLQPSRTRFLTDISFNSYFFRGYLNLIN
ncbi:UPF0481 protein At3g47200-like [Vitis riparia]|uniref:UPF0481 protein At3g47200-like n=1 Tax=Vitis riparia TaxID=96939 RepID=UPI00155A4CCE|nr:UPF0481 protein At3g47200-like [Vitis riparia]